MNMAIAAGCLYPHLREGIKVEHLPDALPGVIQPMRYHSKLLISCLTESVPDLLASAVRADLVLISTGRPNLLFCWGEKGCSPAECHPCRCRMIDWTEHALNCSHDSTPAWPLA